MKTFSQWNVKLQSVCLTNKNKHFRSQKKYRTDIYTFYSLFSVITCLQWFILTCNYFYLCGSVWKTSLDNHLPMTWQPTKNTRHHASEFCMGMHCLHFKYCIKLTVCMDWFFWRTINTTHTKARYVQICHFGKSWHNFSGLRFFWPTDATI